MIAALERQNALHRSEYSGHRILGQRGGGYRDNEGNCSALGPPGTLGGPLVRARTRTASVGTDRWRPSVWGFSPTN